jgi:Icc-related predicted phosphoesterase
MKITVVSDLHLEFSDVDFDNVNGSDVLVLAGDIMVAQDLHDHPQSATMTQSSIMGKLGTRQESAERFRNFLSRCSSKFPRVIFIAGNHEFYHGKFYSSLDHLREECREYPNVDFLENQSVIIAGVEFVCATLWTDMNYSDPVTKFHVSQTLNDYRVIRNDHHNYRRLQVDDVISRHCTSRQYIMDTVAKSQQDRIVVVTHHAPSFRSIGAQYRGETLTNGGYASELGGWIVDQPKIRLWLHGHVHTTNDYEIGSTRIVSNPRGYHSAGYTENTGWDPNLILEI